LAAAALVFLGWLCFRGLHQLEGFQVFWFQLCFWFCSCGGFNWLNYCVQFIIICIFHLYDLNLTCTLGLDCLTKLVCDSVSAKIPISVLQIPFNQAEPFKDVEQLINSPVFQLLPFSAEHLLHQVFNCKLARLTDMSEHFACHVAHISIKPLQLLCFN
jgi:hypothetical protein